MDHQPNQPAKPGTACLGCRRRKLKCSREDHGCANCLKAELPCVYPAPETGVKRKRGPYKKDKAPRERHMEDLVKYLEPKTESDGKAATEAGTAKPDAEAVSAFSQPRTAENNHSPSMQPPVPGSTLVPQSKSGTPEELVKDALIALTKSCGDHTEGKNDDSKHASHLAGHKVSLEAGLPGSHPSARRMFEYWELFIHRVDPLLKIIHCPSFTKQLFAAIDRPKEIGSHIETLLFSVYYCAVSTCTAKEARARFGEGRTALLQRYGMTVEANLAENNDVPALESLQALVLYLTAIRRDDSDSSIRTLFSLAVRMAQLIKLDEDPGTQYPPFEAELRRRLWWLICGLESRAAEEGIARQTSIMEDRNVQIAGNLNDLDLLPEMQEPPTTRQGVTDATFVVMRAEAFKLAHQFWAIKKKFRLDGREGDTEAMQREQQAALNAWREQTKREHLDHCDTSRRFDWLLINFFEAMSIKMQTIITSSSNPTHTHPKTPSARHALLASSVSLIRTTINIAQDPLLRQDFSWYFRSYTQWHAVGTVIAELGRSKNAVFRRQAWAVLDPVLKDWDRTFASKHGEESWEYVNGLIQRAREQRDKSLKDGGEGGAGCSRGVASESSVENSTFPPSSQPAAVPPPPADLAFLDNNVTPPQAHPCTTATNPPFAASCAPNVPGLDPNLSLQPPATSLAMITSPDLTAPSMDIHADPMLGLEMNDFDALEDIDFSAFDAVFGGEWDSSPDAWMDGMGEEGNGGGMW